MRFRHAKCEAEKAQAVHHLTETVRLLQQANSELLNRLEKANSAYTDLVQATVSSRIIPNLSESPWDEDTTKDPDAMTFIGPVIREGLDG